ncbi:hypothetical protein FACS1894132_10980 [Clostridia bacterium]|nr:hypothetical protein FACS1894132_10980 [Clostridia bacterium]
MKKGFDDPRGTMFFYIYEILKEKRPKAFILENVKQLNNHNNGRTLNTILTLLNELGYYCQTKVLVARDFGVPQNRERIIIVGFLKNVDFIYPTSINVKTKVGDILEKNVDEKYTLSDKLWQGHLRRKKMHIEKGNGFGYSLFNENSPYTNTLSARYYKDGIEILIEQKGKNPRKLTPRECARLQGFPETYKIVVSDNQAYRQFGNSVCIPLIKNVAQNVIKYM